MRRLILRSRQSPGDILMLTAAVRDLHLAHPQQFETDVRTSAEAIWENNPRVTKLAERDSNVEVIDMHYPLIHESNQKPYHFVHGYAQYLEQKLGLSIPVTKFNGEIFLHDEERHSPLPGQELPDKFWIMMAGGKYDFTAKWWNPTSYQRVVDHFQGTLQFVQCGEQGHWHPPLQNVINLVGKTSLRQFIRLMHHAAGVVCPVTFAMHLAAAVETRAGMPKVRPCVVLGGGREPTQWEAYPQHQYISTIGALSCCLEGGCWKSRCQLVGDGDEKDRRDVCEQPVQITPELRIPKCLDMITPEDVIRRIEMYLEGPHATAVPLPVSPKPAAVEPRPIVVPVPETITVASAPRPPTHREPTRAVTCAVGNNGHATAVLDRPKTAHYGRRPVVQQPTREQTPVATKAPMATATPPARSRHRVLIQFRHGLGDAAQLTVVLRHLQHYHPDWSIELAALQGKHTVGRGLCESVSVLNSATSRPAGYQQVFSLDWDECTEAYGQWPSTKPTRCLKEVFRLEPQLDLYGYQIARSPAVDQRAREYLLSLCPEGPLLNERFPVVLIHYQGNTSCDKKDLSHEVARRTCETVRELGYVPVILDWDNRSPLIDQKSNHCPQADHALWGGSGTGDAEALAVLIEASSLLIGIDSGPLHVAGATSTPSLGVWTRHHPVHFFDLCPNVKHLVPRAHARLARGSAAIEFFTKHYDHDTYDDLERDLPAQVRSQLTGEPVPSKAAPMPTLTADAPAAKSPARVLTAVHYDKQYYEEHQQAGLDYLNFGDWQQRYGRWFVESFGFQGKRVLDVGCACGSILRGLGQAGAVVEGIDLSEHMIELGRQKWPDMAPLLHVGDASDLNRFENNSWQALHSAQVAEHWEPAAVLRILRELNRIVVPGGLFFCSLDTEELFARQHRDMSTEDPTHICVKPRAWWTEQLAKTGWADVTAEFEPALLDHHDSFFKLYDWDYFIARKMVPELPEANYDLAGYPPEIWDCASASVDPRHLFWMFDILAAGKFQHALEIGCLNGASSTAFVEAINRELLQRATFCDINLRASFRSVVDRAVNRELVHTYEGRSIDLLTDSTKAYDFVFLDGDHRLESVRPEVELLIEKRTLCVMAHDTNVHTFGYGDCDGTPYVKWRFQTAPGYYCLEDNVSRPGEDTRRGMFFATTSLDLFEAARASLRKWGQIPAPVGPAPTS
jgi:ADP-heptose:LPS heptosyltransferase/SAM-dependent methyltransferase